MCRLGKHQSKVRIVEAISAKDNQKRYQQNHAGNGVSHQYGHQKRAAPGKAEAHKPVSTQTGNQKCEKHVAVEIMTLLRK